MPSDSSNQALIITPGGVTGLLYENATSVGGWTISFVNSEFAAQIKAATQPSAYGQITARFG